MVPTSRLLAFAGVAVVLIALPGPSVLFTISRALTAGKRTALLNVVGNELGLTVQVIAVSFGLGSLIEQSAAVFTAVKLIGALYLAYLGIQAIRHRRSLTEALTRGGGPIRRRRAILDGAVIGVTNPKTIAIFIVVLPQFSHRAAGNLPLQLLELGLVFPVIALVLDSAWAIAGGTLSQWLSSSPRRLSAIGGAGGLTMIGLGLSLAVTGRKD